MDQKYMGMIKSALLFDEMLTPRIINFIYWLLLVIAVFCGLAFMFGGGDHAHALVDRVFFGLLIALGGALISRIFCELFIVIFKMNEALQEIRKK